MYKVDYQDLSQQVYETLRKMILTGRLKPGSKLLQDELAGELGVSRTPILSAFSKLEKELLVEVIPRKGAFVRSYSPEELIHVYDIRIRLEPLGAREAAAAATAEQLDELREQCDRFSAIVHADPEDPRIKEEDYRFHMLIMRMSGNELLFNIIASYNIIVVANVYGLFKDPRTSAREHEELTRMITERNERGALRAMFQHVASSRKHLVDHFAEFQEKFDGNHR